MEIPYGEMAMDTLRNITRGARRRWLQIFDCPHCHTECQESWITRTGFIAFVVGSIFLCIDLIRRAGEDTFRHPLFLIGFAAAYFGLHSIWWRHVSTTRKPRWFDFWS